MMAMRGKCCQWTTASGPEGQDGPPQGNLEPQPRKPWASGPFLGFGGSTDGENLGHKNRATPAARVTWGQSWNMEPGLLKAACPKGRGASETRGLAGLQVKPQLWREESYWDQHQAPELVRPSHRWAVLGAESLRPSPVLHTLEGRTP